MAILFKSNIQPLSNIYSLNEGILEDSAFLDQVKGKSAIGIMLDRYKRRTGQNKQLTELQQLQYEEDMYCSLLDDKNELVFGYVMVDGKLKSECRCYNHRCKHFKSCRPDYDLSVMPRPFNHEIINPIAAWEDHHTEQPDDIDFSYLMGNGRSKENNDIVIEFTGDDFSFSVNIDKEKENIQDLVIEASAQKRSLVIAGPGTGKTYTLIKRIQHLIEIQNVDINEMVVLSFSRAAIAEIKQRTISSVDQNEYGYNVIQDVEIRTFDSFATYLLREIEPETDLTGNTYNDRIEMAINCIERNPGLFETAKHIIVDEIQDLVGVRARLVRTILEHSTCGFTFLGDPCQAIYEFQVADSPDKLGSLSFLAWLKDTYNDDLNEINFQRNYRQSHQLAAMGSGVRQSLFKSDERAQVDSLLKTINSIDHLGNIEDFAIRMRLEPDKKYAVLCRDNGKVLRVSKLLRDHNVRHTVQRPSTYKSLDRWIAEVLGKYNRRFMEYDEFLGIYNDLMIQPINGDPIGYWSILKNIEGEGGSRINMDSFSYKFNKTYTMVGGLETVPQTNLVVSTIHRAKGREYDEVILLDNDLNTKHWSSVADEVRNYYVAMTRPKEKLYLSHLDNEYQRLVRSRWVYTGYNRSKKKRFLSSIEVGLERDIELISFVDTNLHGSEEAVLLNQEYICNHVYPGDHVVLVKSNDIHFGPAKYNIFHNGRCIGSMSSLFSDDLFQSLKEVENFYSRENPDYYPKKLNEVYIDNVCSYVVPAIGLNVPEIFRKTMIWNGVYLTGLGRISWEN